MSIFTKSLQNIGRVVRQMGTGGFNAVQARLSQAGLFPGGIAGLDRRGLNTNAGSPSSTGDWAVKLSLPPAHFNQLMANSPVLPDTMMADNGMRFPTTPFINLQHTANYDARAVIHNNFPYYAYQNSQVPLRWKCILRMLVVLVVTAIFSLSLESEFRTKLPSLYQNAGSQQQ